MKNITIFNNFLQKHNKKEIFLYGFYGTFIILLLLSAVIDYQIENYNDLKIELFFAYIGFGGLVYLYKSKNIETSINFVVILSTTMSYVLSISNGFGISIFHIIIPLGYFLLYSLKRALTYFFIHHTIVWTLYLYGVNMMQLHYTSSKLVGLAIASLFVMMFGIFYHLAVEHTYQKLEILNNKLEKANYQKEILLNETHHRIKNNLQMISNMLGLQKRDSNNSKVSEILEKSRSRIHSILTVHEILYKHDCFENILFDEYISKLTSTILRVNEKRVNITLSKKPVYLHSQDILKLGIITNELLINSLKHAFEDINGEVEISLEKKEDYYLFRYKDNGQKEVNLHSKKCTLGVRIINMMVEQMAADLSLFTKKGLDFEMKIPFGSFIQSPNQPQLT